MPERRKIDRESSWAVGLTVILIVLASVPMAFALYEANRLGLTWRGNGFLAPGDFGVYLSYIDQARSGHWLFANAFDPSPQPPALHGFWLLTGRLAALLHLTPTAAFHLLRLLLIPLLGLVSWRWIRELLPKATERVIALALLLFGGGLGFLLQGLYPIGELNPLHPNRPPDLWIGEAFPFLSALSTPHFLAAWILLLLTLHGAWKALRTGKAGPAAWGGLSGLILLTFHPFHAVTLLLVPGAWFVLKAVTERLNGKDWRNAAVYLAIPAPLLAYHAHVALSGPEAAVLSTRYLAVTPHPSALLVGFGLLLPLAGWTVISRRNRRKDWNGMAVWALIQPLAFYGPFVFERRLLLGWLFPLAILAAPTVVSLFNRLRHLERSPLKATAAIALAGLALFNTVPGTVATAITVLESPTHRPAFYFDASRLKALDWVRENVPADSVFLSSWTAGYDIAGWTNRTVLAGHWSNTDRLEEKQAIITEFFGDMDSDGRRETIRRFGLTHIWSGPEERSLGKFRPEELGAEKIYDQDGYQVYLLPTAHP